ncbi:ROK family protein, partial [Treponema sp. OttesenSCG-928-L16]|nr:ROK family protein [Treponema sp. OttesenSCG-928-L16]
VRESGIFDSVLDTCYCAVQGCLESTCSGTALAVLTKHIFGKETKLSNQELFEQANAGNAKAELCTDFFLTMLIRALNQFVYLFCPDIIVIGGGVANSLKPALPRLNEELLAKVYTKHKVAVRISALKEDAGIIGAAAQFFS